MALETNATPLNHNHSHGATENPLWPTVQLAQVNTHQTPDTDTTVAALHHTLGIGSTQAAAGNHAHDYAGPSIFNKPLMICTSTTRPVDPQVGMMVYETDTNAFRVWAAFPKNTLLGTTTTGINYAYNFNTANNASALDVAIFDQTYVTGTSPADGAMGAPSPRNCTWKPGANILCRCIARAVVAGASVTASDDQILTWSTGHTDMDDRDFDEFSFPNDTSPNNDGYLRMSADGNSYVRFSINPKGLSISYTHSGPAGEVLLGSVKSRSRDPRKTWTAKAIGSTYVLYVNQEDEDDKDHHDEDRRGQQIIAVQDYLNVVNIGPNYRGWGIGMTAGHNTHGGAQILPNNLTSVSIADNHTTSVSVYGSVPIWQLLAVGNVPHLRAEAHFRQQVIRGRKGNVIGYDTVLWDWTFAPFTNFHVSQTDITVQESGHYHIHSSIPWDKDFHDFDQAAIGVAINGQDISRHSARFMRGNGFAPGFSQTNELFFSYYLARGDVLRVYAVHNAEHTHWLDWDDVPPGAKTAWLELDFIGP